MRKILAMALLILLMLHPLAGKAQTYISITEMNEHPPERWTQTYETKWRTVNIDVQPTVPQAEKLPILRVVPDFRPLDISGLGEGWSRWEANDRSTFAAFLNDVEPVEREKGVTTTTNHYPPFNMGVSYAKNNAMTLGEAGGHLQRIMDAMGEDQDQWQYDYPNRVSINATISKKTGEPLFTDVYTIYIDQKLQGIPLFCHVLDGVEQPKEQEMCYRTSLTFSICTPQAVSIGGKQVKVTDALADDVPLCDFSTVKSAVEAEIQAGHVRKVFDLDLGYALYNELGVSRKPGAEWLQTAVFYAVPVWRVNCYYVENGKKELRDYKGWDVPERAEIEYKTLTVSAQTGLVLDRTDNRKGCGDFLGFLSWEEAGGRQ